jgi:hypothetical protein
MTARESTSSESSKQQYPEAWLILYLLSRTPSILDLFGIWNLN